MEVDDPQMSVISLPRICELEVNRALEKAPREGTVCKAPDLSMEGDVESHFPVLCVGFPYLYGAMGGYLRSFWRSFLALKW